MAVCSELGSACSIFDGSPVPYFAVFSVPMYATTSRIAFSLANVAAIGRIVEPSASLGSPPRTPLLELSQLGSKIPVVDACYPGRFARRHYPHLSGP